MRTKLHNINADFTCKNCGCWVSASPIVSGVIHRNHCPNCLHSRHVDHFEAGDRLCACKSLMAPVGLTLKRSRDKYSAHCGGEVMLVHRCNHCGKIAINRIAADDDPEKIMALLERCSFGKLREICEEQGIKLLWPGNHNLVAARLFGETNQEDWVVNLHDQSH
jgi:hypothetical protein